MASILFVTVAIIALATIVVFAENAGASSESIATTESVADSFVAAHGVFQVNYKTQTDVLLFRITFSETPTKVEYLYLAYDKLTKKKGFFMITVDKEMMAVSSVKVRNREIRAAVF